ncbi:MAG: XRE family transcriptional regulator, partial [Cytophagaceae bacterium]
ARALGVPQSNVSEIERGRRNVGNKLARRLATVFSLSAESFVTAGRAAATDTD